MAGGHLVGANEDDAANSDCLHPQLVSRPQPSPPESGDRDRRLILGAQPRPAAARRMLYRSHAK